ncbi:MAG: TonB-dependent receptor domain-containing protein [Calditrichia bacterium]
MKYNYIAIMLLSLLLFSADLMAQQERSGNRSRRGGAITGKTLDAASGNPIEYAEIILFSVRDSSQVTGTITGSDGKFDLRPIRPGRYEVEIFFLGYKTQRIADVRVNRNTPLADLGSIRLSPTAIASEAVEVEGRRASVSYQIDKKVISVDENQTAISGSAVDVLENVPSVTVDIDGNVSMRGSSNFRVLIDGRPTILDANDALQQIPATSIENIELITNPSAKYDPEGTAGIINIVMRQNRSGSRGGLVNLNAGLNDKYGADVLYEWKTSKFSTTFGANYRRRFSIADDFERNLTTTNAITSTVLSEGESTRGRLGYGFRGAFAYEPTKNRYFSVNVRVGERGGEREADSEYSEQIDSNTPLSFRSITSSDRAGLYYDINLSAEQRFTGKDHKLVASAQFSERDMDEETINELRNENGVATEGQRSTEFGPGKRLRAKLDYTRPVGNKHQFQSGYQLERGNALDNTELYQLNPANGIYEIQDEFTNLTDYTRTIQAAYAIYGGEWNKLGYQAGLRAEYTDRVVKFDEAGNSSFAVDRTDLFPSIHTSYQLPAGQQMMASYSRRIERPRGWYLEPFVTYVDAFNVRSGNPDLLPEYIDSFELGFQTFFGQNVFSAETYYRIGENRIERVRSVFDENVTLRRPENVGTDYSLGTELMLNMDLHRKWNLNLMSNIYNYRIEGDLLGSPFERESNNWNIRFNNSLRVNRDLQIQANVGYNSDTVSSQGRREGFVSTSMAVKHSFMKQKLSLTLQLRNLLGTEKYEQVSEGPGFSTFRTSERESPSVMLNLRYNLNNYRADRERQRSGGGDSGGDDEL